MSASNARGALWLALLAMPFIGQAEAATGDKARRPEPVAAPAAPRSLSASDLYARLAPSVWVVRTYDQDNLKVGQGSAVVIGQQSLVTNCLVLKKAKRVEVSHEGTALAATLELWDVSVDLCQLKVPGLTASAVELADEASLRLDPKTRQIGLIQTSAPISLGSSGGGLFDEFGRLIGITTAMIPRRTRRTSTLRGRLGWCAICLSGMPPHALPRRRSRPRMQHRRKTGWRPRSARWLDAGSARCSAGRSSAARRIRATPGRGLRRCAMTVTDTGSTVLERGNKSYSETLSGSIRGDLSATMSGLGADFNRPTLTWRNEVVGRFSGNGDAAQFSGTAELGTTRGDLGRHCTVSLAKAR